MPKIKIKDATGRARAALNSKNMGKVSGEFEILESVEKSDKLWYQVSDDIWVQSNDCVELIDSYSTESQSEVLYDNKDDASIDIEIDTRDSNIIDDCDIQIEPVSIDTNDTCDLSNMLKIDLSSNFKIGDMVSFKGGKHYSDPDGTSSAYVKPCIAMVTSLSHGSTYPIKLHRCNPARHLVSNGEMGYVEASIIELLN